MSENLQKLVGVVAMAVLVVVGVAVSSGDDTDFTRNSGLDARNVDTQILGSLRSIQEQVAENSLKLQNLLDQETEAPWSEDSRPAYVQMLEDQCSYHMYPFLEKPRKIWDCSGAEFQFAIFSGLHLNYINFQDADLENANFSGASLIGANFQDASLVGTNFRGAMLRSATFRRANFFDTNFSEAMLQDVDFEETDLSRAYFYDTYPRYGEE